MPNKINITTSPQSEDLSQQEHQHAVNLVTELDALLRSHGVDSYLLTVHTEKKPRGLYSTMIGTLDSDQATHLLADAFRAVQELTAYTNPTAPGGTA